MATTIEEIQKRLMDLAVDGIGLYIAKKATEFVRPYIVKTLRQYSDGAFKLAMSLADLVFPRIKEIPYLGDWLSLWGRRGVEDILVTFVISHHSASPKTKTL
jgi:hypothetical protein